MGFIAAGIYLTIALLVTFGVIPDLGLFVPREVGLPAKITMMVMVTCVYMVTLWQARLSRRATYEALERSNDAIRLARQREAQLEEANQNLEGALRAGAGKEGRYTGSMAGRYLLAEVVGRGAMGEVYAASHVDSGARAAVKLLHATVLHNQDLVRRFIREAEVTARLKAPNVIAVYEAGEAADGAPFIAMELLRGHDLSWHLRQRKSLPIEEVAALIRQVALGLDAAHAAGVIHRDLKPQNLLLTDPPKPGRPVWKILDFGVSKLRDSSGTLTEGAVVGTPGYMAPEQAQSRDADHRCDLFALGAVAYRALTGRPPFSGGDTPQILFEIVYRNPTRPSDLALSIPIAIEQVLAIALAKRPEDRFDAATELSAALDSAKNGALDPALERRAEALLAKHPWGRTARDRP
jgi:serine/threonine-protein kinase